MNDAPELIVETIEAQAFMLWAKSMSYAAIARELGIDYRTAKRYVDAECADRRVSVNRESVYLQQSGTYERVRDRALSLLDDEDPQVALNAAKTLVSALQAMDRLHGLVAPGGIAVITPMSPLAAAVNALPHEAIYALIRSIAERKEAEMRRVTPIDAPASMVR